MKKHTVLIKRNEDHSDNSDTEAFDLVFNKLPRYKYHGDDKNHVCVLPFSAAFVFKKINDFEPETSSFKVALTTIIRIKFTGIKYMKEVMQHCEKNLKC